MRFVLGLASFGRFGLQICVAVTCLSAFASSADTSKPDQLIPFGRYYWAEDDPDLGGLSALIVTETGRRLETVSDSGFFFQADIQRGPDFRITDVTLTRKVHLRDGKNRPVLDFLEDAESMTLDASGLRYIAFEGYTRIVSYLDPEGLPKRTHSANLFRRFWNNASFEALATLPDGRLIAIIESPVTPGGGYRTFTYDGTDWTEGHPIPVFDGFKATGADVGPDGRLYLVERQWFYSAGFSTRIRRFDTRSLTFTGGRTLLQTDPAELENMEGISVWNAPDGRTILSLLSDDNYTPFLNTLIVEYVLPPDD